MTTVRHNDALMLWPLQISSGASGGQVYATSMAMLVTMAASVALFGLEPSLQLALGIATAIISLMLYYLPASALVTSEAPGAAKIPK